MKQTLLILFLLLTIKNFGQDCENKLAINKTDFVTKNKVLKSAFMSYKVNFKSNYTISFELKDRVINLISTSTSENVNDNGQTIEFDFESGENLKITFDENSKSEVINKQTIQINQQGISYKDLELFAIKTIKSVNLNGIDKTIDLKEKRAKIIKEYTNCFFVNIDKEKDLGKIEKKDVEIPSYYKPCNFVQDEIDEFEGYRKKALHYAGIAKPTNPGFPLFINLKSINGELWMTAELDAISYCITKNSKINIKLENGTIIRLQNKGETDCGKRSTYLIQFTKTDKELLKESPMKLIRLETEDGNIDLKYIMIKNYFIENIDCI
ncbi:hypothetical protein [Tenacibaculum maritimum]|uniref:hypothetical protein n=1 Tax=Tenacibaculum maritimum TaxID=107401 RepID=UPI001E490C08|nr:hypothetical protein [Tenacibaculum maritimum]MCD9611208.1 hypothetical protein [Tenacibaculum maritimum]